MYSVIVIAMGRFLISFTALLFFIQIQKNKSVQNKSVLELEKGYRKAICWQNKGRKGAAP